MKDKVFFFIKLAVVLVVATEIVYGLIAERRRKAIQAMPAYFIYDSSRGTRVGFFSALADSEPGQYSVPDEGRVYGSTAGKIYSSIILSSCVCAYGCPYAVAIRTTTNGWSGKIKILLPPLPAAYHVSNAREPTW